MAEKKLKASIIIGGALDASLKSMLLDTRTSFRRIGAAVKAAEKEQKSLNNVIEDYLKKTGYLKGESLIAYDRLTAAINRTKEAVKGLHTAEAKRARLAQKAATLRGWAGSATVGTLSGGAALGSTIKEASHFQTEVARLNIMGVPDDAKLQALQAGRELKNFGTSIKENVGAYNDGLAVFGNMKEARMAAPLMQKMAFANRALYGTSSEESERQQKNMLRVIDIRGGANNSKEFAKQADYIQRAYVASKGMVNGSEFFKAVQHGGTAVRGMSNDAFYFKLLPLMQEMHGDQLGTALQTSYNSLVQGHTSKRAAINLMNDGLIADSSKVSFDKAGQIAHLNPGALKGSSLYTSDPTEWVKTVMLPQLVKTNKISQNTMNSALAGKLSDAERQTLTTVIGSLGNSNTGKLLSTIAMSLPQIDRDSKNARNSTGINGTVNAAQKTAAGQQMGLKANLSNLKLNLGQNILPLYTSALMKANTALEKFNSFITKHPKLTRAMVIGASAVTLALAASIPVLLTAGAAMNVYGGIVTMTARREALLSAAQLRGTAGVASKIGIFSRMGSILPRIGVLFSALTGPVGIAIAAITVGALLVYKYWRPIKAFFSGLGKTLATAFAPIMLIIKPVFSWIVKAARSAWKWIKNLTKPIHGTAGGLKKMGKAGQYFGKIIGVLFKVTTMLSPIRMLLVTTALLIYRYWQPLKAFFSGLGEGLKEAFAPIMTTIKPVFGMISHAFKKVWSWFSKLTKPTHETAAGLKKCGNAGRHVGKIIGRVFEKIIKYNPVTLLIKNVGKITKLWEPVKNFFKHLGTIFADIAGKASVIMHPMGTLKSLEGKAASSIKGEWQSVKDWWSGKNATSMTAPAIAVAGAARNYAGDIHNHTYNITQQPGQSSHELAREIHKLSQKNNRRGVALADGAD